MGPQKRQRGSRTLFRRMLVFLLAILLVQMFIYLAVFFGGGIMDETERNAFYILSERTANRKLDFENDMLQRWSNVKSGKSDFMGVVNEKLTLHEATVDQLSTNPELCQEILEDAAEGLVAMLRRNGVTGVFAILNAPTATDDYPGVYIRDYDPINFAEDNADLLLERGLPQVARQLSIPMDSYWSALFRFGSGEDESPSSFYYHPLEAAMAAEPRERQKDYFYHWSTSFALSPTDRPVVSYSVPLVWEDGTVIGVIGVDLTVDYLSEQLNYNELGEEQSGSYFLGVSCDGSQSYEMVCASGPMFKAYYGQPKRLTLEPSEYAGIARLPDAGEKTVYGAVQSLKLYNNNTPFENEHWVLVGIQSAENLLNFSDRVRTLLLFTTIISFALGLAIVFMAARSFTSPISQLVGDLRRSDPNKPISLRRINITELDTLSESIEELSNSAAEAASHISKIIAMSHIPIGVFEYRKKTGTVFCSKSLFALLGWPEQPEEDAFLPEEEFLRRLHVVTSGRSVDKDGERVFRIACNGQERWAQFFYRDEDENALGAFLDVTDDVAAKRKIEYERDYDVLTGHYNRRAFDQQMEKLFREEQQPLKTAALIMLDLDNLKYMNDSYGHDYGDRYIQAFAQSLKYFHTGNAVVGRRSGDEFNIFLYGYDSEEEVREVVNGFWSRLGETTSALPGGEEIKVRASGGMAWFGKDAEDYFELLRLADFAMYNVKHTIKGALREFNQGDYDQKAILIQGQDALNRMLENRMVRYALQPIVSAVDGSVYGYEFLMRPMMEQLSNLENMFRLAKAQSKLQQIEVLTWTEAMSRFAFLARTGQISGETRAFINSVGNQRLPNQLLEDLEERYQDVLARVVVEITENEEVSREKSAAKKEKVQGWGGMLALDDYGSGYNTESALLDLVPDIVKVDIAMVRKIDSDSDRLALVRNLIGYAKSRNIIVLAEGVESASEMDTLISCGVDYLQGYYLARPDFSVPTIPMAVVEEIQSLHKKHFPDRE